MNTLSVRFEKRNQRFYKWGALAAICYLLVIGFLVRRYYLRGILPFEPECPVPLYIMWPGCGLAIIFLVYCVLFFLRQAAYRITLHRDAAGLIHVEEHGLFRCRAFSISPEAARHRKRPCSSTWISP